MGLKVLPEKVFMNAVIIAFDLTDLPTLQAFEMVLMHTNDSYLNLYCDNDIIGIEASEDIGAIFDEYGHAIDFEIADSVKTKTFSGPKIIENAHVYSDGSRVLISIHRFSQNNINYFVPDESGSTVIDVTFSYQDFYLNGHELSDYIENRSKKKISAETNKSSTPKEKKQSKQSLRESKFKTWLAVKANIPITGDSSYQECYKKIGEPTQKEVWKMLQGIDQELFALGKDDFFKFQGVIDFKGGTGKGRKRRK